MTSLGPITWNIELVPVFFDPNELVFLKPDSLAFRSLTRVTAVFFFMAAVFFIALMAIVFLIPFAAAVFFALMHGCSIF